MNIKPLPHNIQFEQCVLWAMLIDSDIIEVFFDDYSIEMFFEEQHKEIISAMFQLKLEEKPVDIITVQEQLRNEWELDNIWWLDYLIELTQIVPTTANWKTYAEWILLLHKRREIILESRRIEVDCYNTEVDLDNILEKRIWNINNALIKWKSKATDMWDNISKLKKHLAEVRWKSLIWYSWWIPWLDDTTKWIRKWKTYRIWSPSWVWKTNLVYPTIYSLLQQWAKVLFVSLENSIETTYIKMLSSIQKVNSIDLEMWRTPTNIELLEKYRDNFFLTDQLFDINEIKREVLRVKPDVVILDYIWLVSIRWCDERTLYDKYADEIKTFVQKNNAFAWIDLSNLNKDDNEDKIRMYKWFNWSAKLRNNTDFALHLFYHKPFYDFKTTTLQIWQEQSKNAVRDKQVITFFITKNRLWRDWEEEVFVINYNQWYNYIQATEEQKALWKSFS